MPESNEEDWEYLMGMYSHLRFLRINIPNYVAPRLREHHREWSIYALLLINAPPTPRTPNRFGVPFSRMEFLMAFRLTTKWIRQFRGPLEGPVKLLWRMTMDLYTHRVNIIQFLADPQQRRRPRIMLEFLTDHVPMDLRSDSLFIRFLRCSRDLAGYVVHAGVFYSAIIARIHFGTESGLNGNVRAALFNLTHLQAAAFMSGLEAPGLMDVDPLDQMCCCGPRRSPPIECVLDDPIKTPCGHLYNRDCMMLFLRYISSDCADCGLNMVRVSERARRLAGGQA
ncbi:hypothetical protein IQ07DRAFT_645813 [Pyrenochaeta sp. DS3sAY3a]|nr:hypothetical protein IQ07DRAFT_645813 [Pyrenochaeta sp. DS3sAY3a]